MKSHLVALAPILRSIWTTIAVGFFVWACLTERPYLAAFFGVFLICEEIRDLGTSLGGVRAVRRVR